MWISKGRKVASRPYRLVQRHEWKQKISEKEKGKNSDAHLAEVKNKPKFMQFFSNLCKRNMKATGQLFNKDSKEVFSA